MRELYEPPELVSYGPVVSLTLGNGSGDIDGVSGMQGNDSSSDQMPDSGSNAG
jgi:hypothetical protein